MVGGCMSWREERNRCYPGFGVAEITDGKREGWDGTYELHLCGQVPEDKGLRLVPEREWKYSERYFKTIQAAQDRADAIFAAIDGVKP